MLMPNPPTPEQWQRLEELYLKALAQPIPERTDWLARNCEQDAWLQNELQGLLAVEAQAEGFWEANWLPPVALPQQIGPYRVLRELSRGGMGIVYLAARTDGQFEKQVAIKLLRQGLHTAELLRRFRAERQILAQLEHPHIARLLDGGTTEEGLPYLVMEYVQGEPLTDYCSRQALDLPARLRLFLDVCAAVQDAHRQLVIHRDLKPANIFVTEQGVVKLLDFGLAKLLSAPEPVALMEVAGTVTRLRAMTPEYASPEQVRGDRITTASDVYSLGVVLYELLVGRRPYELTSYAPGELLRIICEQEPERPSRRALADSSAVRVGGWRWSSVRRTAASFAVSPLARAKELRGDLDNILLKALRKEPTRRYASVEHLAEDVRRYLAGQPVGARKGTVAYRCEKFIKRHTLGVTLAALAGLSLFGMVLALAQLTSVAYAKQREAEQARAQAELQRGRAEAALQKAEAESQRATTEQARALRNERQAQGAFVQAESQRARAERRFTDVRQLAEVLLGEVSQELLDLPGSLPVRSLLARRGSEYLDRLAQEAAGDVSLQQQLAKAYDQLGATLGNSSRGEMGDVPAALRSYERALRIRQSLLRQLPHNWRARYDLALSHVRLGNLLLPKREREAALAHFQQAWVLLKPLAAAQPQRAEIQQQWFFVHRQIGLQLIQLKQPAAAQPFLETALTLNRQLAATKNSTSETQVTDADEMEMEALGSAYQTGVLLRARQDLPGALREFQRGVTELEQAAASAYVPMQQRHLNSLRLHVGDVLKDLKRFEEATTYYRAALAGMQELSVRDQADARTERILISCLRKLGQAFQGRRMPNEAYQYFQQATARSEELAVVAPNYVPMLNLAPNHWDVGQLAEARGELATAVEHYQRAIHWHLVRQPGSSADLEHQSKLGEMRLPLAALLRRTGQSAEALEQYRQLQAELGTLFQTLPKSSGTSVQANSMSKLSGLHSQLGNALAELGQMSDAALQHRLAISLLEEVLKKQPAQGETRWQLSRYLHRLGRCLVALNDAAGAVAAFQRAVDLREALATAAGATIQQQLEPTFVYNELGALHSTLGAQADASALVKRQQWEVACAWYGKSLRVFSTLQQADGLPNSFKSKFLETQAGLARCRVALEQLPLSVDVKSQP